MGPSATATDTEKNGMPRFAFTDPSIGSTTTRIVPPPLTSRTPASSDTTREAELLDRAQPVEDALLGARVDRRRLVAALALAQDGLPLLAGRQLDEQVADVLDRGAAGVEPGPLTSGWNSSPETSFG